MIVSRTPLRISFVGGGTDMPVFYRAFGGAVINAAISRCVYITVNPKFDNRIRVSYSRTEDVSTVGEIAHSIVRTVLQKLHIPGGVEITSIADIPSHGTGLGSSSAFCVGLLNAMHAYCGRHVERRLLADEACEVEIDMLKEPIGKQDQYASALGGLNYMRFDPGGAVEVLPLTHMQALLDGMQQSLLLLYTGIGRSAAAILTAQQANIAGGGRGRDALRRMLTLVEDLRREFQNGNVASLGEVMHEGWLLKRSLAEGISSDQIDDWYRRARAAGATGGKILGAGGGGFMLLFAPPDRHHAIVRALPELRRVDMTIERRGTTIVFNDPAPRNDGYCDGAP
jgi:D-glycero-alpha-D-manno-heptose-7-phosphate kinase